MYKAEDIVQKSNGTGIRQFNGSNLGYLGCLPIVFASGAVKANSLDNGC